MKNRAVPDGLRRLKLTYIEPIPVNTVGVYCLFFGNHFYIGKSVDVRRRLSWHLCKINELLAQALYGRWPKPTGSHSIIISHLVVNKHIDSMDAILLYIAASEKDALDEELNWLDFLSSHELNFLCLNKWQTV